MCVVYVCMVYVMCGMFGMCWEVGCEGLLCMFAVWLVWYTCMVYVVWCACM